MITLENASLLEIILVVFGLALTGVNVWGVAITHRDVRLVRNRRRASPDFDFLLTLAKRERRNETIRLIKQMVYNSLWLVLAITPAPIRQSVQFAAAYAGVVLLLAQILLALATLLDRRDNRRLQTQAIKLWPSITRRLGRHGGKDASNKTGNGSTAG